MLIYRRRENQAMTEREREIKERERENSATCRPSDQPNIFWIGYSRTVLPALLFFFHAKSKVSPMKN
jgi:hypothetical protein